MDQVLLNQRFALRGKQYIFERFAKAPNITKFRHVTSGLLSYAPQDKRILPLVDEAYRKARSRYGLVRLPGGYGVEPVDGLGFSAQMAATNI